MIIVSRKKILFWHILFPIYQDDDIARFLKALPNWQAVQDTSTTHESITETPQDVDSRNLKEIAMLKQNLGGDSDIPAH